MAKKLTEIEMYYAINSADSDAVVAKKLGCTEKSIKDIRAKNKPVDSSFDKLTKGTTEGKKQSVRVMTEAASQIIDDSVKVKQEKKQPDHVTSVFPNKRQR